MSLPTEKLQKAKICMSTNLMTFERELMTYRKFSSLLLCGQQFITLRQKFCKQTTKLNCKRF
jgi:hypothetical protein